jgi:putative hemolysin
LRQENNLYLEANVENTIMLEQQDFPKFPDVFSFSEIFSKPYRLAFNFYQRNVGLSFEKGRYEIKTASEPAELEKVLQLRNDVFYREKSGRKPFLNIDIDRFDLNCDHLMVVEKATGKVLGTYRLNSSRFSKSFYSTTEFNMDNILSLPGVKLELGRACIHKDFRNGMIISLLWRGICEYMKLTNTKYLFGCSSIETIDPVEIGNIHKYFADKCYSPEYLRVQPKNKFAVIGPATGNDSSNSENRQNELKTNVPPLLKLYLKAGAFVCGAPALDKFFKCADFFTFLDVDNMNKTIERRFSKCA